jgi:hypothetical protein
VTGKPALPGTVIGVVDRPLAAEKKRTPRKRAAELVWLATSDLARGSYRAKSAAFALLLSTLFVGWLLQGGDSAALAGGEVTGAHQSKAFLADAQRLDRGSCLVCHVGVGQVSTLKCLDCHPDNRPAGYHVQEELECQRCHREHRGSDFRSAVAASLGCKGCHPEPHAHLARTKPKLVKAFRPDAPLDVELHLIHQEQEVGCSSCHAGAIADGPRGARAACGGCHAPDDPAPSDCRQCHREHPDRDVEIAAGTGPGGSDPPRFRQDGLFVLAGLLILPFFLASIFSRRRPAAQAPEE